MTAGPGGPDPGPFVLDAYDGLLVGHWPSLGPLGVDAVVTTRQGGVSSGPYASLNLGLHVGDDPDAVLENRRRALRAIGAGLEDAVFAEQVHGCRVAVVGEGDAGRGVRRLSDAVAGCDALVTVRPGLVLVMLVADCIPAVAVDPEAGVLAVVHAGWRGTAQQVMAAAVHTAVECGAAPERLHVALGPAVPARRYRVGPEVAGAVAGASGPKGRAAVAEDADGPRVDLVEANTLQLETLGVAGERVLGAGRDTEDDRFFSDRRTRPCGRFALMARLHP